MFSKRLDRRTFLRGVGAAVALPTLDVMAADAVAKKPPVRMVYVSFPFGVTEESWFPEGGTGPLKLSPGLAPLQRHLKDVSVIANLGNSTHNDGHAGCTTFLTCANLKRNPKLSFSNSVSCDQVAARYLGKETRFASLSLSAPTEIGMGSGLSMSWDANGTAIPGLGNPVEIYNQLFGGKGTSVATQKERLQNQRSILDVIGEDAKSLSHVVSRSDSQRIDQYFTAIREIEKGISREESWVGKSRPDAPFKPPERKVKGTSEISTFYNLMAAALQTDSTRVISYRQPLAALLDEITTKYSTHQISHYPNFDDRFEISQDKDKAQSKLFAGFLDHLADFEEADGSRLLDNCLIAYGVGTRKVHGQRNIPLISAGGRNVGMKQGQHIVHKPDVTPLANMWLTMFQAAGMPLDRFSESNDIVKGLLG